MQIIIHSWPGYDMYIILKKECDECENWFHFDCIGFLGDNDIAANLLFYC